MGKQLTPHKPGSVREILSLSVPMMITALSGNMMVFLDRVVLGHYSLDAMNAGAAAGTAVLPFTFGAWAIAAIAEVFVGQFNGAEKYDKVAKPVWQMIWFSLLLAIAYIPLGFFGGKLILAEAFHAEGLPYFKWVMAAGFLVPMNAAIGAFFIGRGKTKIITLTAVVGNILNLLLDVVFVFGVDGLIPSLGTEGAAMATAIAELFQVVVLLIFFLKPEHKKQFQTHRFSFDRGIFKDCLRIGFPNAVSHTIEMSAWYIIFVIMAHLSKQHVTVLLIGQSIFVLFAFLADGIQKGVTALASNAIGENKMNKVPRILVASLKLHVGMVMLLAIPLLFFPDPFIKILLKDQATSLPLHETLVYARMALAWVWVYLVFDDVVWIISGILTSAGDTKFVMIMNGISVWAFAVMPVYGVIYLMNQDPSMVWQLTAFYGLMNMIFFIWRYRSGKWKSMKITTQSA